MTKLTVGLTFRNALPVSVVKVKKLKSDKFFMASHLRTTGCHRSMVSHNFTCSPT